MKLPNPAEEPDRWLAYCVIAVAVITIVLIATAEYL